jgi:AcrR family transcriptional regulator
MPPSWTAMKDTPAQPLQTRAKNSQPARSRAKLRDALVALLSRSPFDDITVNQIVAQAGVGYATFFRHYPDRRALWIDVSHCLMHELATRCRAVGDDEPTERVARTMVDFVTARYNVFSAILSGRAVTIAREEIIRRGALENADLTYVFGDLPADLLHSHVVNGLVGLFSWWMNNPGSVDAETLIKLIDELIFKPVTAMRTP